MESGLAALPVAVTQQNNTITNTQKNKGGFGGGLLYILRNIGAGIVGVGEGIYDYIVGGFAKAAEMPLVRWSSFAEASAPAARRYACPHLANRYTNSRYGRFSNSSFFSSGFIVPAPFA